MVTVRLPVKRPGWLQQKKSGVAQQWYVPARYMYHTTSRCHCGMYRVRSSAFWCCRIISVTDGPELGLDGLDAQEQLGSDAY